MEKEASQLVRILLAATAETASEVTPSLTKIVPLRRRSPSEERAYREGFEAGLSAAAEAISKSLESYRTTRPLFRNAQLRRLRERKMN
jgi:hypothetical protein